MTVLFKQILDRTRQNKETGFTLIEVLVAIFIGLIVMAMAVAILGSTNSTALRVLAKSEVQQNTRASVIKLLDTLSNAQSLDTCRIATNAALQGQITSNPEGRPGTLTPFDCKETSASGYVLALAQPNKLCYFVKEDFPDAPKMSCITRGGVTESLTTVAGMVFGSCANDISATEPEFLYIYTCNPNGGNAIDWPANFNGATNSAIIAELGTGSSVPVFNYILDESTDTDSVPVVDLKKIIAIDINFEIDYKNYRRDGAGTSKYFFKETIVLRGSKKAQEENYNG